MAGQAKVPYVSQNVGDVTTLLHGLEAHSKGKQGGKRGFSCKKSDFQVVGSRDNLVVTSWRFQDWDYKRDDLPTYARGLFLCKNKEGQPEIAVRGYDKFFNTGEVPATRWETITANTKGPYELSLKENGCIIFISGLCDDTLLVCSKHSTGPRADADTSHAIAGERWIDRQLKAIGRTRQELARELRARNATAVAELCDDEFEEHILAYGKDQAGLYLHGININVPEFITYPGSQVQAFAETWGFRKTDFLVIDDIAKTKSFLESVAETGHYNGRDVEGFVIRCQTKYTEKGPYVDWFFKYKFEEPYLMYRQWRECTKALIAGKPPRFKKHKKITEEYILYAKNRLMKDSKMAKAYQSNHGIIALRDDFLKEKNLKGSDIIRQEYAEEGESSEDVSKDVILCPIATLGCGKTTIAVALQHLFGWGLVQNDNITGKNRPPRFTKEVLTQLEDTPVVVADRNNASRHERKQILEDVHSQHLSAKLVALHFNHKRASLSEIRKVTQDRVLSRGDNHQTIQAATDPKKFIGVMEGFLNRFEELDTDKSPDDGFDGVIELDPTVDSRENLETVISQLNTMYPKLFTDMPTSDDLDEAIKVALNEYKPELRHEIGKGGSVGNRNKENRQHNGAASNGGGQKPAKPKALEYVSVSVSKNAILNTLDNTFKTQSPVISQFYRQLQQTRRVQAEFHVTLIHRANSKEHADMWKRYSDLHSAAGGAAHKLGDCQVLLERIVWNDRIMAIVVRLVTEGWDTTNRVAHITVGTRAPEVKPKESNDLLQKWLQVGSGEQTGIHELVVEGRVVLDGNVRGVLSR